MRPLPRHLFGLVPLLLAPALLAGCTAPDDGAAGATFRVGGAFHHNATEEEIAALSALVHAEGGSLLVAAILPPGPWSATDLDAVGCERVRAHALAAPYVVEVGACQHQGARDTEPAEPVGSDVP